MIEVMSLEFHPFAALFPLIHGEEYESLKGDIEANGIREPVQILEQPGNEHHGKIIDGRNRYRAAKELKIVDCPFKKYTPESDKELLKYIISLNLHRRHLTAGQRAALAVEMLPYFEEKAKERQRESGGDRKSEEYQKSVVAILPQPIPQQKKAREEVGNQTQVGPRYVSDAKRIKLEKPALFEEVKSGEKTLQEAKREIRREENRIIAANPTPMPDGLFNLIYADPPWTYDFSQTKSREIENQYPTMTVEELENIRIPSADDCLLLLWATAPKLIEALEIMKKWGFDYKTHAIWDKQTIGMGYWFRGQHELLLIGTKGSFPPPEPEQRISSVFSEKRTRHSAKPDTLIEWIERAFPNARKLELFSRVKRNGWSSWGNQL